jgi:hypothetical protein
VTIVFAKRSADTGRDAAQAGRDAVRDERAMRIEEDFRRFAEALIMLYQHAGDAQQDPENPKAPARMRQAQIRVVGTLIPRARIDLPDYAAAALDKAVQRSIPADQVHASASVVLGHVESAWDTWLAGLKEGDLDPKGPPLTIRKRSYETPQQRGDS